MVVTDLPSMSETGMAQERTALPSICTVQAPQAAMPQPNLVPVIWRCSRNTHSSGVLPSTPTSLRWPLTVNAIIWRLPGLRHFLMVIKHPSWASRLHICVHFRSAGVWLESSAEIPVAQEFHIIEGA